MRGREMTTGRRKMTKNRAATVLGPTSEAGAGKYEQELSCDLGGLKELDVRPRRVVAAD